MIPLATHEQEVHDTVINKKQACSHGWVIGGPLMHGNNQDRMEFRGMVCRTGSSVAQQIPVMFRD